MNKKSGFTVVELLVVIVTIGVLAAISLMSYSGISKRSTIASIQSDLTSASRQLKIFQVTNSSFPSSVTDCPNPESSNICLKMSGLNYVHSYDVDNTTNPQTFLLKIKKSVVQNEGLYCNTKAGSRLIL